MKLGFKIWKQQMEKNYPLFLYQMKYDRNLKFFSYQWFMLFLGTINFLIVVLLQNLAEKAYIVGIVIFLITYVGTYFIVFDKDKYYEYQTEFIKEKKYNHPTILLIVWITITIIICIPFLGKYILR